MEPMSEETKVVEKRVTKKVIRRRQKPEEVSRETAPAVETSAKPETAAPEKTVAKGVEPVAPLKRLSADDSEVQPTPRKVKGPAGPVIRRVDVPSEETEKEKEKGKAPVAAALTLSMATQKEKEEKLKRGAKRRKTAQELELEDIQRAGGLKQFATQVTVEPTEEPAPEWTPPVERVYEPGLAAGRKKRVVRRDFKQTKITELKTEKRVIPIEQGITVKDFSQKMGVKTGELIRRLMDLGLMVTANQSIDVDTATLVAGEYGFEIKHTAFKEEAVLAPTAVAVAGTSKNLKLRPPVVTVMGHVDHGKTSILDAIRKTKVTEGEAGGITQHIGAYQVTLAKGKITFIDTPGHAAFSQMRARGTSVTDIVVLVVAADDGIMPQTVEAIHHAKAAGVPILVAINKIDKPQANADKVKRELSEEGLLPEDWGGDVICCPTSATTGEGLDHLLEMILLTAEMKELKADPSGGAQGTIIESKLEKGRGPVVTVLIQSGTLSVGDTCVAGQSFGRVRAMTTAAGEQVKECGPSTPVELLGLDLTPDAGEKLFTVKNERDAKQVVQSRRQKELAEQSGKSAKLSLEDLQARLIAGEVSELPIVIKADVAGSAEALRDAVAKIQGEKVSANILHTATGGITESDVILAQASGGIILGFNVTMEGKARKLAEHEGVQVLNHSIIYEALDDIKKLVEGMLEPVKKEVFLGRAEVKQVFRISKVGQIAGCLVQEGLIRRNAKLRLSRDGAIIYEGIISSLKRFKDDAREVENGKECGIGIEHFNDVKEGDLIEAFVIEEQKQKLS